MRQIKLSAKEIDTRITILRDQLKNSRTTSETLEFSISIPEIPTEEKVNVILSEKANTKMMLLTEHFKTEVAWHGTVQRRGRKEFYIDDILVYPQKATGCTVQTDPYESTKWALDLPEEIYNAISLQGHSHVDFGCQPSATDKEDQCRYLSELGDDDFYIFTIWNKRGETYFKIYDMRENAVYEDSEILLSVEGDDMANFIENAEALVSCERGKETRHHSLGERNSMFPGEDRIQEICEEYESEREMNSIFPGREMNSMFPGEEEYELFEIP